MRMPQFAPSQPRCRRILTPRRAIVHRPCAFVSRVAPVGKSVAVVLLLAALMLGPLGARAAAPEAAESVKQLLSRDLIGAHGKEVRMISVAYPPGAASLPHRHDAQVFVYVLEGSVIMQAKGSPAVTLGPGETFYEGPDDIHLVSANASHTAPAKILVFMVKDKAKPASRAVSAAGTP
jgi:quercetin dioxygenase-like cupin family protein